jgi:hypothetical protein
MLAAPELAFRWLQGADIRDVAPWASVVFCASASRVSVSETTSRILPFPRVCM